MKKLKKIYLLFLNELINIEINGNIVNEYNISSSDYNFLFIKYNEKKFIL